MDRYKLVKMKAFESISKFETRLNEICGRDWRIVNLTGHGAGLTALLERESRT